MTTTTQQAEQSRHNETRRNPLRVFFSYRQFARASGLRRAYVDRLKRRGDLDDAIVGRGRRATVQSLGFALAHLADEIEFLQSRGLPRQAAKLAIEQLREHLPIMWYARCAGADLPHYRLDLEYEDGRTQQVELRFLDNAAGCWARAVLSAQARSAKRRARRRSLAR